MNKHFRDKFINLMASLNVYLNLSGGPALQIATLFE
jgi:hypothetical protein